jgi:DNA-binding CsgD family transcriptional regulator
LSVLVIPFQRDAWAGGSAEASAIVFANDPESRRLPAMTALAKFYRLTPAETRLLEALLQGERIADYADRVGISINTANTQLKQIFVRTETSGIGIGTYDSIGLDVTPVGNQPTTPQDGTTVQANQGVKTVAVPYLYSPAQPDQFFTRVGGSLQTGQWTFSLSNPSVNGGAVATIQTAPLQITTPAPFVKTVTLVANGLTPNIQWVLPPSDPATSQTVYAYDRSVVTPSGHPLVYTSPSFSATQTSFAIPSGVLVANHQYTFSVQEDVNSNGVLAARSRSFVDFRQNNSLPPGTILQLPLVNVGGSTPVYNFNFPVGPGQIYYLDPAEAIGYLYQAGNSGPLFASVSMPSLGTGTSYTLCLQSAGSFACDVPLAANQTYDFAGIGVDAFEVMLNGIGFDPNAGLPFVTALSFEGSGQFTGTITPLVSDVPEPASLAILGFGIAGLSFARKRRDMLRAGRRQV